MSKKIAVIGGGASGLMSAICAARCGAEVTVYERQSRVGKKILATGNGRCNLTNAGASAENYHGGRILVESASCKFWVGETLEFFEALGMITKCEDDGRIYPYSEQASSVLDVLRFELERLGVRVECGFEVKKIKKTDTGFRITAYDLRTAEANTVILACGGKASPDLGSNGTGYELARLLGHTVTELRPSLVQFRTEQAKVKPLKGIKIKANVKYKGKECFGELLFTDYGISGPPVFSLSSMYDGGGDVVIDMMPEYSTEQIAELLSRNTVRSGSCEELFVGILNKRVGMQIVKNSGIKLSVPCSALSERDIISIASGAKRFVLTVEGTQSWNNAQVTAGGVCIDEVDKETLESNIVKNIYITGELLDVDGDCGGYNLQWAWTSGYIAGIAAAGKGNEI